MGFFRSIKAKKASTESAHATAGLRDRRQDPAPPSSSPPPPPPSYERSCQISPVPPPPPYLPSVPIVVNQHYYLGPLPGNMTQRPATSGGCSTRFASASQAYGLDQIVSRFDSVMTLIDQGQCTGNERDLLALDPVQDPSMLPPSARTTSSSRTSRALPPRASVKTRQKGHTKGQATAVASSVMTSNLFAKVELYANSSLPLNLPPMKLHIPTFPLLCLAAQHADRVYERPVGAEAAHHIDASWRAGTKAMHIKSVSMDHMNTIVFAIRGTASFRDWCINLDTAPTSPAGFLDDPGNLCHAGFLAVARTMVRPVAARLRQLLDEAPARAASHSLLITGHSAGGAVAALLYCHMLATSRGARSELGALTGRFRCVHCVTFGAPPVSLLPLAKPGAGGGEAPRARDLRKSLFLSFVNEGDPVARADKAYVRSLLELFAAPAPAAKKVSSRTARAMAAGPVWRVPRGALSNAGRIVVLRSADARTRWLRGRTTVAERLDEGVVAQVVTDEQLRGVVWGDPVAHVMALYARRIEDLAVAAVTAKGY